jgi:peptidyl-prolyl cis-trans isomerase SurA
MKKLIFFSYCVMNFLSLNMMIGLQHDVVPNIVYKEIPNVHACIPDDSYVVDEILVIIYGPERTRVITAIEVERLSIDGRKRTLDDLIIEELIYQEALKFKIPIDESIIDRYISNIRKQYNLSLDDVKQIFKQSGYTFEEGCQQLRVMYATNAIIENIITSRLHVSREDVLAYYEKHPVVQEAKYQLQMTLIPFDRSKSRYEHKQEMVEKVKEGKIDTFVWYDPFWLKESEIAQHMNFITAMKQGDISIPIEVGHGFELYRLTEQIPQSVVPLENRYKEIENILRQPQFQKKFEEYKKSLYDFATIVYYNNQNHQTKL